jgi:SAM-dependent methyltransferase
LPVRSRLRPVQGVYLDWRRSRPLNLGVLRRTTPIDASRGSRRGTPIDRVYVERFIGTHAADVRGRILEVAAPDYTARYGTNVELIEVLRAEEGTPDATVVGDLADAPHLPSEAFDCVIADRTLQFVYDVRAAFATIHRVLATGGVLLATVPGIAKVQAEEGRREWWHFTGRSALAIAEETFGPGNVEVETYGNVLTATGVLYGLAAPDLRPDEIAMTDPRYEVVVAVRAVKGA